MTERISEIIKLLASFAPDKLEKLKSEYPTATAALRPTGVVLGSPPGADVTLAATREMLASVGGITLSAAGHTGRKLRSASKLDLFGGVVALASSAGVVGTAMTNQSALRTAALGLIGFLSSAIPIVSRWLRTGTSGEVIGPAFQQLTKISWEAQTLRAELDRIPADEEGVKLDAIISKANELAKSAFVVLTDLGYAPTFHPV
jgi:hypothetical protein